MNTAPFHRRFPNRRATARAFTMIEVMGSMMVLGLVAMAMGPSLRNQFDNRARGRETTLLEKMSDGYVGFVRRTRRIPDAPNLAPSLASQMGWHTNDIQNNERGQRRIYLLDPAITNTLPLPYIQSHMGVTHTIPARLGVLFVSSLTTPLPKNLVSGLATTTADFDAVWNCPEDALPSGWTWTGKPQDLRIERVNLSSLFVPVNELNLQAAHDPFVNAPANAQSKGSPTPTPARVFNLMTNLTLAHIDGRDAGDPSSPSTQADCRNEQQELNRRTSKPGLAQGGLTRLKNRGTDPFHDVDDENHGWGSWWNRRWNNWRRN